MLLTPEAVSALHRLDALAPLHQPASLAAIELVSRRAPDVPQFGCFDTAFHSTQPRINRTFALPSSLAERGVRRYGFHGLSYEHAAQVLKQRYGGGGRAVIAHLGAGASLCALKDGISVATTMGMTPLGGIPMATRPGDLDPGAVLHMLDALGMSASQIRETLYRQSGLLGLSGESGDLQILLTSPRVQAAEAVAFFIEAIQREIASLAGAVGGLDTLVFTAGIGERAPVVRARIGAACAWLGVRIDQDLNDGNADEIHDATSAIRVLVVRTNEESVIVKHMRARLLG
jgi:acetate kinase